MGVNLSLRVKLLILVLSVVVGFGVLLGVYVSTRVAGDLDRELLKRGVSIAKHLAEICTEDFIEDNRLHLQFLAHEHQTTETDIRYILMTDREGKLLAHSFGTTFPAELATVNRYVSGQEAVIVRLDTGGEVLYDIAVPVLDGRVGGLRVGMSAAPIRLVVNTLIREILLAILIIGLLAFVVTLPVAQAIARPLSRLTQAIEGLSKGRRDLHLPADRRDEIGTLNEAFNQMTADVRLAEKHLAAQVHFLRVLMEDLPVPVFYKNMAGETLGCNSAFAGFWGKDADQIIGRGAAEIYPPEDASLHQGKDAEALRQGRPLAYEHAVTGADGLRHDIVFHKAPFRDEDGLPAGIIGVMHDVTLQRDVDRSKSEFISMVAHEFQTPLATILGFSELLHDDALGEEERKNALQLIIRKAEALSQMVDELLDLARLEGGCGLTIDKAPCDLNRLLTENVDSFRRRITTHRFSLQLPSSPLVAEVDVKRIGQVVENLLSNAVKYSGETSSVHVSAEHGGKVYRITIRDEGVGMSPDQVGHLFDKFYRGSPSRTAPRGTGLGLFIAKAIIDAHQGNISIDSVLHQGTTVTVELPLETKT
jgi:PAS domain S-box-containing protein